MTDVSKMTLTDLRRVTDALVSAHHTLSSIADLLNHSGDSEEAADFLNERGDALTLHMERVATEAYRREPADDDDTYERLGVLASLKPHIRLPVVGFVVRMHVEPFKKEARA